MSPLLSAMLGAGILSGSISYHVATTHFEIVTSLSEWFLHRVTFTFLFYLVSASIGIIFMTAGRRGSEVDEHVQKHGDSIATFYASAGGSVLGWVTGVCLTALLDNPLRYWLLATLVVLMAAFILFSSVTQSIGAEPERGKNGVLVEDLERPQGFSGRYSAQAPSIVLAWSSVAQLRELCPNLCEHWQAWI